MEASLWREESRSAAAAPPARRRVLLVGKGPPDRGGIAAFLTTVLDAGLAERHDVQVLNLTRTPPAGGRKLTARNLWRVLADAAAVWRAAADRDVVHVHSALASTLVVARAGLFALAGRMRGCRVVVHAHSGRVEGWLTTRTRQRLVRLALAPAGRVIAVAGGGRGVLAGALGTGRVALVDNGVDPWAWGPPGPPSHPPRVLFAGGLTARKGVIDLLRASDLLRARGLSHELLLAGGTPDEGPEAEARVRAAAGPSARFLGAQPHEAMRDLYRHADLFCLPSWGEAMSLSILEAMASGLPVVASRVGDVPRAVDHDVTGLLVDAGDPDALADALGVLLGDPRRRRRMGAAGRQRLEEHFSAASTVAALDRLYCDEVPR